MEILVLRAGTMELTLTKLGESAGVTRLFGDGGVTHGKRSREFNLQHRRFVTTIRHVSGNIK